jgi:hypothetical protein
MERQKVREDETMKERQKGRKKHCKKDKGKMKRQKEG